MARLQECPMHTGIYEDISLWENALIPVPVLFQDNICSPLLFISLPVL